MKQQLLYVAAILILMFFAYRVMAKVKDIPKEENKKPRIKPDKEIPNDKIILVENVTQEQITSVLENFCRMYNEDEQAILPRLTPLSENKFAITFPFNDALEIVCYLVNYLNYPIDMKWDAIVHGWATVENELSWIDDKEILNKEIMLYCFSEKEDDYEYTEIVTSENVGYRINLNSVIEKDEHPQKQYITPEYRSTGLNGKDFLDFE